MDKYKKLAGFVNETVTAEFIAGDLTNVVKDMLSGVHPMDTLMSPGWTLRDILSVQGFYVVPEIVEELIACYVGRFLRLAAVEFGINPNTLQSARKMGPILMSTNVSEKDAVDLAIAKMQQEIGVPVTVDTFKAEQLIKARDNAVKAAFGQQ
jgi:hypothetical protein